MLGLGPFAHALRESAGGELVVQPMVVDHAAHGCQKLGIGAVTEATAAQEPGFKEGSAPFMNDDRRTYRERLEHDVSKSLGEKRWDDHRPGAAKETGQRRASQKPLLK